MKRMVIGAAGLALAAALALAACKGATVPADAGAPVAKAAGDAVTKPGAAAPTGTGKVACDAPEHDYGTVTQGQEAKHTFVLKNVGDGVLRILNARGG